MLSHWIPSQNLPGGRELLHGSPTSGIRADDGPTSVGIRLNNGTNPSLDAGYGGPYDCRDPPCQRYPDSMANIRLRDSRSTELMGLFGVARRRCF
ncbi:hypothetical protein AHAS_Ahas04G0209400 [Arachis hypogaea]